MAGKYRVARVDGPTKKSSVALPIPLFQELEEIARENGRSVNQEIVQACLFYVSDLERKPSLPPGVRNDFASLPKPETRD